MYTSEHMDAGKPNHDDKPEGWREWFGLRPSDEEPEVQQKKKADEKPDKKPDESKPKNEHDKQTPTRNEAEQEKQQQKREAKRRQVIRRSRARLEEAEARDPYMARQYSPIERVELAVARQIVTLDTRLNSDRSLDGDDIASLEHSIDFMGLMADKLRDPGIETAPEVEAAVAVLLEPLLEPLAESDPTSPIEQQHDLTADMKDMVVAIASTTPAMIERWLHDDDNPSESVTNGAPSVSPSGASTSTQGAPERKVDPTYKLTRVDPEQILETANDYRRMVPTVMRVLKKERKKKKINNPGVAAVGGGGSTEPTTEAEPDDENASLAAARPVKQSAYGGGAMAPDSVQKRPDPTRPEARHLAPHPERQTSDRPVLLREVKPERDTPQPAVHKPHKKVEHMSLPELLREAETIPVGYGRFLRRAYESGEIDQEALTDVIKSYRKGKDYRREFTAKRAAHQRVLTSSPEIRREPGPVATQRDDNSTVDSSADVTDLPKPLDIQPMREGTTKAASDSPSVAVPAASSDDRAALLGSVLDANQSQSKSTLAKPIAAVAAAGAGVALIGWLILSVL